MTQKKATEPEPGAKYSNILATVLIVLFFTVHTIWNLQLTDPANMAETVSMEALGKALVSKEAPSRAAGSVEHPGGALIASTGARQFYGVLKSYNMIWVHTIWVKIYVYSKS